MRRGRIVAKFLRETLQYTFENESDCCPLHKATDWRNLGIQYQRVCADIFNYWYNMRSFTVRPTCDIDYNGFCLWRAAVVTISRYINTDVLYDVVTRISSIQFLWRSRHCAGTNNDLKGGNTETPDHCPGKATGSPQVSWKTFPHFSSPRPWLETTMWEVGQSDD